MPKNAVSLRSIVGTINVAVDDPRLERSDRAVRDLFAASLARPFRVSEARASYEPVRRVKRSRRRG